jgi:hypothetical protein
MTQIRSTCSHCGGEIVTESLLLVLEGEHQGIFHPGCLRQVRDGETVAKLRQDIAELKAALTSAAAIREE